MKEVDVNSLLRWVLNELDALGNVALQPGVSGLEELLLVVVGAADDIDGFLGTAGLQIVSMEER